jgi:transcriptional regulator with XRE-family HTH domain
MKASKEFIELLRRTMALNGWTQRDVAKQLGVSHSMVSNYLAGRNSPALVLREKLAQLLEVPVEKVTEMLLEATDDQATFQDAVSLLQDMQVRIMRVESQLKDLERRLS